MKLKSRVEMPGAGEMVIGDEECCPGTSKYVAGSDFFFVLFCIFIMKNVFSGKSVNTYLFLVARDF